VSGRREDTIARASWKVRVIDAAGRVRFAQQSTDGRGTLTDADIRRAYDSVVLQPGERAEYCIRPAGSARYVVRATRESLG
jgi:hypothetical protein